jgi:hypothetical protein
MEPVGSVLCSIEPITGPYPEPDAAYSYFLKIQKNILIYVINSQTRTLSKI